MSLWMIAWRSIQSRSVASILTCFSMALGVTLVVAVLVINSVVDNTFNQNQGMGYDLVVGKKGGDYQLVLNTLFHLSRPIENLPYSYYKEFVTPEGKFKGLVNRAIPYCLGDNYEGFRVVGTVPAMFDPDFQYNAGKSYTFTEGRNFKASEFFEGVVGSTVARQTGLRVGDQFSPTHSLSEESDHVHHDKFTVVGILAPTGTPNDRALFVNIEGFYLLDGHAKEDAAAKEAKEAKPHGHDHDHGDHDHGKEPAKKGESKAAEPEKKDDAEKKAPCGDEGAEEPVLLAQAKPAAKDDHGHSHDHGHDHGHGHAHHEPLPESQREVTAILVRSASDVNPMAGMLLTRNINKGQDAQAVSPIRVVTNLFSTFVDPLRKLLVGMAVMVVLVAGIGILVNIYNSMNERRREIAVMRALGARRSTVFQIILLESIMLSLIGGLAGWVFGHALTWVIGQVWLIDAAGVSVNFWELVSINVGSERPIALPLELLLIGGLIVLASVVGYLPAMTAYRTDVSKCLASSP